MKRIPGTAASGGIIMGCLRMHQNDQKYVEKYTIQNTSEELKRLQKAQGKAVGALNEIYLKSLKRVGKKDSMIFEIHMMMIQDEDYSQAIRDRIRKEKVNAEYAVWETGQDFAARFAKMDSEYMRSRKADVIDISRRLIQCLNPELAGFYMKIGIDELSVAPPAILGLKKTLQQEAFPGGAEIN